MKLWAASAAITCCLWACNGKGGPSPAAPSATSVPSASATNSKVSASAYDLLLKKKVTWSQDGNTLTVTIAHNPYGEEVGPFILLLFNNSSEPQQFLAATLPLRVDGFGAQTWTLDISPFCGSFQWDLYAGSELTDNMKNNRLSGGYLVDHDVFEKTCSTPNVRPSPPPPNDVCPNLEGVQSEVPDGYHLNNDGLCVPNTCDIPTLTGLLHVSGEDCPPPTSGACYYEPDCGNQDDYSASKKDECDQAKLCTDAGGAWVPNPHEIHAPNKCRFDFPGISKSNFQLNPGISAPGCLDKHDD